MTYQREIRIAVILLFAMTFTLIGWIAPLIYASNAPADHFIESHNFVAENTSTSEDSHLICFDRTVNKASSGQVFTELYLVDKDDNNIRREISSETIKRYFQSGRQEVVTSLELPDNIRDGQYKYLLIVRMDLADGRITRDFTFESDKFTVSDDATVETPKAFGCE